MKLLLHNAFFYQPLLAIVFSAVIAGEVSRQSSPETYENACVHCPDYILNTADYKENVIMSKVYANEYDYDNLPPFKTLCDAVALLPTVDFNNVFDRFSDERPAEFDRFFHFHGILASVRFDSSEGHNFTGIFKGADHGVLRFSPIAPLLQEKYLVNHFIGSFPFSFAIKFFRDGIHSGNINVGDSAKGLRSRERQFYELPNFNIFSRELDNLSGIGDTFDPLFGEFEKFSGVISPADAAAYDQSGQEESAPKSPLIVRFRPPPQYKEKFGRASLDFRKWATDGTAIPPGTIIYTAWTTVDIATGEASLCVDDTGVPLVDDKEVASQCPDQKVVKLGDVVMKTRFYSDAWTDRWLFFQHHRMCPKDQSICKFDENASTTLPEFSQPDQTYPFPQDHFCISSDDKSGEVTGNPPSCPTGSNRESDYCYHGNNRSVEKLQKSSCPFMNQVAQDILTTAPGADTKLPACNFGFKAGNFFLTGFLSVISPALRGVISVFPPSKTAIDFLFGLLPFGRRG